MKLVFSLLLCFVCSTASASYVWSPRNRGYTLPNRLPFEAWGQLHTPGITYWNYRKDNFDVIYNRNYKAPKPVKPIVINNPFCKPLPKALPIKRVRNADGSETVFNPYVK